MNIKEILIETYHNENVQIFLDLTRVFLLILAILIFLKLVTEIDSVKVLQNDPCRVCENKTGAICSLLGQNKEIIYVYPLINWSQFNITPFPE